MSYMLRLSTPSDYAFLRNLHHTAYRDVVVRMFGAWDEACQDRFFDDAYTPGVAQIVIVDGQDVGALTVWREEGRWFLAELQIDPRWQGHGIGTAVLRDLVAQAHAASAVVALQVLKANRARALYERLGFQVTGETETHYLMRTQPTDHEEYTKPRASGTQVNPR